MARSFAAFAAVGAGDAVLAAALAATLAAALAALAAPPSPHRSEISGSTPCIIWQQDPTESSTPSAPRWLESFSSAAAATASRPSVPSPIARRPSCQTVP